MPRLRIKAVRTFIYGITAVVLSAAGIRAADSLFAGATEQGPCPQEMALVESVQGVFCIDKYEASAGEKCPHASPENQRQTTANLNNPDCRPVSTSNALPWRFISRDQAQEACAKAGKRLPANQEWTRAALGTPDKQEGWTVQDCNIAGNWDARPGPAGMSPACVSSAGAYDMAGNVWEWVAGTVVDGRLDGIELPQQGFVASLDDSLGVAGATGASGQEEYYYDYFWIKPTGLRGVARGGYWNNREKAGKYSAYIVSEPAFAGEGVGFRCAAAAR